MSKWANENPNPAPAGPPPVSQTKAVKPERADIQRMIDLSIAVALENVANHVCDLHVHDDPSSPHARAADFALSIVEARLNAEVENLRARHDAL